MLEPPRVDRRLFERMPVNLPVRFVNTYTQKEFLAHTRDVSATGIGLVTDIPLSPNDDLEIWLQIPDHDNPLYTKGRVIWSKPDETDQNRYRAGVKLEKMEFAGMSFIVERAFPVLS